MNQRAFPWVNEISLDKLANLFESGAWIDMAWLDSKPAGALIAFNRNCGYHSEYFDWFFERYRDFTYFDRLFVEPWARRKRIAWRLYEHAITALSGKTPRIVTEAYSDNQVSINFHEQFGFHRVGIQVVEGGHKEVVKLLFEMEGG
jgi:predicted GNAT superfamily acetyltransferase